MIQTVQTLGSREDEPLTITAQGQEVAVVEGRIYLFRLPYPLNNLKHP